MLPSSCTLESMNSLPFEFPPGHHNRICEIVEEIKQLFKNMSLKAVLLHTKPGTTVKKTMIMFKIRFCCLRMMLIFKFVRVRKNGYAKIN